MRSGETAGTSTGRGPQAGQAGQAAGTLVGRRRETALLEQALRDARAGTLADAPSPATAGHAVSGAVGGAIVLRGDIGIGKTALLDWTAARAGRDGFGVLRVAGDEAGTGTAFGALHRLLRPLRDRARALPPHQLAALERAAGLRDGLPAERFMVGAAALALVAAEARHRPLLLLVDDLHWVDPSSAAVFLFLHQRLTPLPVVMVCASRPERSALEGWPADPVEVEALSGEDSTALLRHWHPKLTASAARRVVREAAGNPLALAELPGRLTAAHHPGMPPLPDRLPLGERLERLFAHRLRSLPASAAQILLLAALGGTDGRVAADGDGRGAAQDGAERSLGLIEASGLARLDAAGRLEFRHPLVRSTVIAAASAAERGAAHRLLAGRLRPDDPRRLAHEAAAADGPDPRLAARLQEAGTRLALRGGDAEGALLLDRAAALSTDPDDRARRLTWAAVMSARGGRLAYAAELVAELRRGPVPRDVAPLFAYAVVYVDQSHHVDFESTFTLLPGALDALTAAGDTARGDAALGGTVSGGAPSDTAAFGDLRGQMVFKLLLATAYTGDPRGRRALERHREHLSPAARLCLRSWA
ncbi:AAA family ATPase, partial [Streptomyces flavofungini]|uniref:AAA family ATPase n=1 Tax=Streptomyces flavofungini TaxID=68200 RepID=UPI0034DFF3D9